MANEGTPPRDDSGQFIPQDERQGQQQSQQQGKGQEPTETTAGRGEIDDELAAIREQEQPQTNQPGTRESVEQAAQQRTRQRREMQQQGQQQTQQQGQQQQPSPNTGQRAGEQGAQQQAVRATQQGAGDERQIEGAGDGQRIVNAPASRQQGQRGQQQPQGQPQGQQQAPQQQQSQQAQQADQPFQHQSGETESFGPEGDWDPEANTPEQDARDAYRDDPSIQMPDEQQPQQQRQQQQPQQQRQRQGQGQGRQRSVDEEYEMWSEVVNQESATVGVEIGGIHFEMHSLPRKKRNKYMRQYPSGLFTAMQKARNVPGAEDGNIPQAKQEEIESEISQIDMIPTEEGTEALVDTCVDSLWHPRISTAEVRDHIRQWDDKVLMAVALRAVALSSADARVEEFRFTE